MHRYVFEELNKEKWINRSKVTGYPKVAKDLAISMKKYGIHPDEYLLLNFYDLDNQRRERIISRKERDAFVKVFNKKEELPQLEEKINFLTNFKDYVNREFLLLKDASYEDYLSFLSRHPGYVAKQSDSGQGKGVEVVKEVKDPVQEFQRLKDKSYDLLEEVIDTHEELREISPAGTPAIRIFTFVDKQSTPHIIFSAINLSTDNPVVNFGSGALKALIDPVTGKIVTDGISKSDQSYGAHPFTGHQIKGRQLPDWDNLRKSVLNAAMEFPDVRYIGWDCTISSKGAALIEANAKRPGINGQQLAGFKKADERYSDFEMVREEFNELTS